MTMSQKRTVTTFRSPSSALRDVRIFAARCWGVYAAGDAKVGWVSAGSRTGCPHWGQNLAVGESGLLQAAQARVNGAPHSSQNLAAYGFSRRHLGQVTAGASKRPRYHDARNSAPTLTDPREWVNGPGDSLATARHVRPSRRARSMPSSRAGASGSPRTAGLSHVPIGLDRAATSRPTTPARLSRMLCWRTAAVNRQVDRPDQHG